MIPATTLARCLFVPIGLALLFGAPCSADAQNGSTYSYILRDTPFATNPDFNGTLDPNTIFAYNTTTKLAVPSSQRLANAINAQIPGALVDAITYGHGAICLEVPHGDLFWSISRIPADGGNGALPSTALYDEANDDSEADLFWVPNVPETNPNAFFPNVKAVDDNSAPGVRNRFLTFPNTTLGLHGKFGTPNGAPPQISNLAGFDHHPPAYAATENIYFSITEDWPAVGPTVFESGDILLLDTFDTITIFRTYTDLGLTANDNIDALTIDIHHSDSVSQCRVGLLSVTRDSSYGNPGDLFLFYCDDDVQCQQATGIYRWASASGIHPGDGDIDCIVSIDPRVSWTDKPGISGSSVVITATETGRPESFSVVVDTQTVGTEFGTSPSVPVAFATGDDPVIQVWGKIGEASRLAGACKFEFGTGASDSVTSLDVTAGITSADLTWNNPVGTAEIEIQLDQEPPILLGPVSAFTIASVAPGVHTVSVRSIAAGVRSLPEYTRFEIEESLPMPSGVGIEITGDREVTVSWTHDIATTGIEVALDGAAEATLTTTPLSVSGSLVISVDYGYRRVTLQATSPGGDSGATSVDIFVPRPAPGTILQSTAYTGSSPYGMTYVPERDEILISDRTIDLAFYYDRTSLAAGSVASIPNPLGIGTVRGVTVLEPDVVPNELLWVVEQVGGNAQFFTSDALGSGGVFALSGELPFPSAGDVSVHPGLTDGYIVTNLAGLTYQAVDSSGTPMAGFSPVENPAPLGLEGAVAARSGDTSIVIPTAYGTPGVTSHATTLEMSGTARTQSGWTGVSGTVVGMVYVPSGSRGVPSIYCVTDALIIYEIAAQERLPVEEDCHLPLFGGIAGRNSTTFAIPDDLDTGVVSGITLTDTRFVGDVDVVVGLSHERMSDVRVELTSPAGTTVTLQNGVLPYQESMIARYDDLYLGSLNDDYGDRSTSGPGQLGDFDGEMIEGTWTLRAIDTRTDEIGDLEQWSILICPDDTAGGEFVRGDINGDGLINIGDPVFLLAHLFTTGPAPPCQSAADVNDDGNMDLGDAVAVLSYLFAAGAPPPAAPFPTCGTDPTPDGLTCDTSPCP